MAVTAKVILNTKTLNSSHVGLLFHPDYQNPVNREWASATPHLELKMTVTPEVGELFNVGDTFTLAFERS